MDPVELHAHSSFSFLDALTSPEELARTAKEYGYAAVALTDHGGLFGVPRFLRAAESAGIKPVVGCEMYVSPTTRADRSVELRPIGHHLTLLAETREGYENLARLSTIGYADGFYYRPRIDRESLGARTAGIIVLTGCVHSAVCMDILAGNPKNADARVGDYVDMFGRESVYVEIQDHGGEKEKQLASELHRLARARKLRCVVTNDVHYLDPGDADTHRMVMDVRSKKLPTDPRRERFLQNGFHLLTAAEWRNRFSPYPDAMEAAAEIAGRCAVRAADLMPKTRDEPPESADRLKEECLKAARLKFGSVPSSVQRRVDEEIAALSAAGMCGYVRDISELLAEGRRRQIAIGPGRGSSAGSLVCHLAGITEVDPLKYGLSFDRFLAPSRSTLPDIDVDIDYRERNQMIDILKSLHPSSGLLRPGVYPTFGFKTAVREVARCRGIPYQDVTDRLKQLPVGASAFDAPGDAAWKDLDRPIACVSGLPKQTQGHPTGVILIDSDDLPRFPLYTSTDGAAWLQYDGADIESMGIPKLDLLPLKILAVLSDALRRLKMSGVASVEPSAIPLDDEETFRRISEGRTAGVFQLESGGMRNVLRQTEPRNIDELAASIALHRPGPLEAGIPKLYADRKTGVAAAEPPHDIFRDILSETFGLVLYQEQVIACARKVGLTACEADAFRIAASKKDSAAMKEAGERFERALHAAGLSPSECSGLMAQILPQAEFAFNKAHAISYAILTYRAAYLKTRHPAFFMAAAVNASDDDKSRLADLFSEIRFHGIAVLPPDINSAAADCFPEPDGRSIRMGLNLVKHLPATAIPEILKARTFADIPDLLIKVPSIRNAAVLTALAKSGALDEFGKSRAEIIAGLPAWIGRVKQSTAEGGFQDELFGETHEPSDAIEPQAEMIPADSPDRTAILMEHEAFGFFATASPMDPFSDAVVEFCSGMIDVVSATAGRVTAGDAKKGAGVTVAGLLMDFRPHTDKSGREMGFGVLEDGSGRMDFVMFHDVYVQSKPNLVHGAPLLVRGRLEKRGPFATLLADQVVGMDHPEQLYECVLIKLDEGIGMDTLRRAKEILMDHPGDRPVFIDMMDAGRTHEFQTGFGCRPSADLRRRLEDLLGPYSTFFLKKRSSSPSRA